MCVWIYNEGSKEERRERERSIVRLFWPSLMNGENKKRENRVCSRGGVG